MDKEQIIQLRNHHLKQGRNNDRRPIYPTGVAIDWEDML